MMLLKMSISSGILILLIIILRSLAINKLPKKLFVLLWNIALLRLLLPFDLPIHYGIALPVTKIVNDSVYYPIISTNAVIQGNTKELIADTVNSVLNNIEWTTFIWFVGMIMLLIMFSVLYFKEYQKIQAALPITKETENYFRSIVALPKRVKLLVSDRISTPLTFGIFSPKIILPKILKSPDNEEIKYVLTHEMIHIKRFDNLWKIIMLTAVSIHWFNPLVWIMYILFNRDIELSCDEKVITHWGETTKKEYAMALVNLAEKQYHWSFFSNGFGKKAIQERIVAIMKFKKTTYISIGCAILLLVGAITVFAQNDSKAANTDNEYLYSDREGIDTSASSIRAVANSEWFSEYEKYGLSYNSSTNHLIYDGEIVGYFKDETSEGTYTRVLDSTGVIGVIVLRDSGYKIVGLEKTDIPDDVNNSSSTENTVLEDNSTSTSVENNTGKDTVYETNIASENTGAIPSDDIDYEEGDGNNGLVLKDYESYGIFYNLSKDIWTYNGKHIAGLIDNDNIYVDGSADNNSVYLQIDKKSVKEISVKQFNELVDNIS